MTEATLVATNRSTPAVSPSQAALERLSVIAEAIQNAETLAEHATIDNALSVTYEEWKRFLEDEADRVRAAALVDWERAENW